MGKTKVDKNISNLFGDKSPAVYVGKPLATLHSIYISGEIESADNYTDAFELIRAASEHDVIKIHINSVGGDLFTAIQWMRVLKEAQCMVACSVEGACMSAATLIFLAADQFEISDHSVFMFHNYSRGMAGKGGELYDSITFDKEWSENMLKSEYEGVLDDDEIESVLSGKDIWLSADEMGERLANFIEVKKQADEAEKEAEAKAVKANKKKKSP